MSQAAVFFSDTPKSFLQVLGVTHPIRPSFIDSSRAQTEEAEEERILTAEAGLPTH